MKPNDKAIEAARAAILKMISYQNSLIEGRMDNESNTNEIDRSDAIKYARVALDAAYAAQFPPSEDYAGLVEWLRNKAESLSEIYPPEAEAADALEALLAELEACKKGNDSYHDQSIENHNKQVELNKRIGQLGDENKILAKACAGKYVDIGEFEGDKLNHMFYNTIIERNGAIAERAEWKEQAEIFRDRLQDAEINLRKYFQENDKLKAELNKAQEIARMQAERIGGYIKTIEDRETERDALLARLAICERMMDKEYRDAFTVADNSNTVAAQIVSMRHSRKWTQKELAEKCGMHQPQISALEDPDFENFEVATLQRVASAFDVALLVRFVRFSELARLAPVEDEELQKNVSDELQKLWESRLAFGAEELNSHDYARAAIKAARPHIEAAERERCAKVAELHSYPMKTVAGTGYNNAAKEIAAAIRRGK